MENWQKTHFLHIQQEACRRLGVRLAAPSGTRRAVSWRLSYSYGGCIVRTELLFVVHATPDHLGAATLGGGGGEQGGRRLTPACKK